MKLEITVKGLEEVINRMQAFPSHLEKLLEKTMDAVLLIVWENLSSYPPRPENSTYRRTGTLGKTLGIDESGARTGKPDIYEVKKAGAFTIARFGTRLEYAPYVIGDKDKEQAWMHQGRWWTLPEVAERARDKITQAWQTLADRMAKFVEGRD